MGKRLGCRIFVYFLCTSFLSLTVGSPKWIADAKERTLPVGEMVSRGGVKFEVKENVWKDVDPSHFPLFPGVKIKTTLDGVAAIALMNRCQVEAAQNSVLSFEQHDRIRVVQGKIDFRIPAGEEVVFHVGNLTVAKPRSFQASQRIVSPSPEKETIGSISVRPNGSVTVKNIQGSLSVLNQDRTVLAALFPKEAVTFPSVSVTGKPPVMVAQAGETRPVERTSAAFLGASAGTWLVLGFSATALGVGVGYAASGDKGEGVTCP